MCGFGTTYSSLVITILKHIKLPAYDALVEIASLYAVPVSAVKLLMVWVVWLRLW